MKILITGSSGQLGQKLLKELRTLKQLKLRVMDHLGGQLDADKSIEHVNGDLLNPGSLKAATQDIDVVIHLAAITHTNKKSLYYQINTAGTKNLLAAAKSHNVKKFVFLSSRVAGETGGDYAKSKMLAEAEVEKSGIDWVILCPSEIYGAGRKEAIARLLKLMAKSYIIPVIGAGRYTLAPVLVDDVVKAIVRATLDEKIFNKRYILAGPEQMTYLELIGRLAKFLSVKRIRLYLPLILVKALAWILAKLGSDLIVQDQLPRLLSKKSADISLAKQDLNFQPVTLEAGIKGIISLASRN